MDIVREIGPHGRAGGQPHGFPAWPEVTGSTARPRPDCARSLRRPPGTTQAGPRQTSRRGGRPRGRNGHLLEGLLPAIKARIPCGLSISVAATGRPPTATATKATPSVAGVRLYPAASSVREQRFRLPAWLDRRSDFIPTRRPFWRHGGVRYLAQRMVGTVDDSTTSPVPEERRTAKPSFRPAEVIVLVGRSGRPRGALQRGEEDED